MKIRIEPNRRHRIARMVALFFFFCSIYMLTYSGRLFFNDELQMVNTTQSLVEFGDEKYDLAIWYVWTNYGPLGRNTEDQYALPDSPIEPLLSLLGIPLYYINKWVNDIGSIHTIWLLNIFVGGAICTLFFLYARKLGHSVRVSFVGALLLGFGTMLWPYTRTFFREPLAMFFLLAAAYYVEIARRQGRWWLMLVAGTALLLAFLTKETILVALPALLVIAVPQKHDTRLRRVMNAGLVLIVLVTLLLLFTDLVERLIPAPTPIIGTYSLSSDYFRDAFRTYLLSIGGSIWGTSPVLLLGLPGAVILWRRQQPRYVLVMVIGVLGFAFAHAITAGRFWSGGATWPPRFLLPVIPFMLLPALPLISELFDLVRPGLRPTPTQAQIRKFSRRYLSRVIVAFVVIYSVWWQLTAILLSPYEYTSALPPESGQLAEWMPGLNTIEYMRPVVLTPLLFQRTWEIAWVRMDVWFMPVLFAGITFFSWRLFQKPEYNLLIVCLPVVFAASAFIGLRSIYSDPVYLGDDQALHEIAAVIDEVEAPNDVVLLSTPKYHWFFLNHREFDEARIVALPLAPGERGSFEEAPHLNISDAKTLLQAETITLVNALAAQRSRLWILMDNGPFLPWSIRPLERYMQEHYYHVRTFETSATVRLLEYSTRVAVHDLPDTALDQPTDFVFDEHIMLESVMLPLGETYSPGGVIPLSLVWQATSSVEASYTVAVFLADERGAVVAQAHDSQPVGGFAPTNTWQAGDLIQDNRALLIPPGLGSGQYELWVRLYTIQNNEIVHADVAGINVMDDGIAVLPIMIRIQKGS